MGKNTSEKKKAATKRVASKKTTRKSTASGKLSTKAVHGIAQLHTAKVHGGSYLTTSAFKGIVKDLDVGIPIWSGALHMSAATLEKRMEKNTAFHPLEEDRLLAVQQVLERGMEVFEDADDLEEWLKAKHALLQNQRPMDLLGSTPGIGLVMLELGRIEHGIY